MEVILLEKVINLGDLGDRVNVKSGYGRNFLVPQGKAVPATAENLEYFESRRAELENKAQEILAQAEKRAEELNQVLVNLAVNASEEGKLFGSIGPVEIARAITEAGHDVEKKEILMPEGAIHNIGSYTVNVQLHSDVVANVKIEITSAK